ncbi:MAG: S8 family serine peptidase [Acidobacteria bacterium]|nr:S8 family serine peptidase [Acidobacteriota bacterium]
MQGHRNPVWFLCAGVIVTLLTSFYFHADAQDALSHGKQAVPAFVPGRLLVKFRRGVRADWSRNVIAAFGARTKEELPNLDINVVELPDGASEEAFAAAFKARADVEFAELDRLLSPAALTPQATMTPNDPWYSNEWYLSKISAPLAWMTTTGSGNITVAILDTGVDSAHPDFAGKLVPGWNVYDNNADTSDVAGHGTAVAGVVGAASNNGAGVASVAWGCRIMPIRISDVSGYATYSTAASGLIWAADHGARVANISYIVTGSSAVTSAANYFQSKGGVVTVAAGNSSAFDASPDNPAMLTVSAITGDDVIWASSNTGNNVDVCAPYFVYTTIRGGTYSGMSGTSVAAPIVAGVAALVLSANPALTASQVQNILKQSADDLGSVGWDSSYGSGRVNAARALSLVTGNPLPPDTTPPSVAITLPIAGSAVSGTATVQVTVSDNVGVASVSFGVDGVSSGTDTEAPYSFSWNTTTMVNGVHTLSVVATDAAGNTALSSIALTVNNVVSDTTPPTVSFTAPVAGSTVSGTVFVQMTASDNVGVSLVSFRVDGVLLGNDAIAPYSFFWDTTAVAKGIHTLTATASDAAGNTANNAVTVTVGSAVSDTIPPSVSIASPAAGSTVSGTSSVQVTANDNVGVASVSFSVDGVGLGTDTTAPYGFSWNTAAVANGPHTLTVTATDTAGNTANSLISVTVSNAVVDTTPPVVSFTTPITGGGVSGVTSVQVAASDNVGVVSVSLSVDGALSGTDTTAPYSFSWNTAAVTNGAHALTATATDAAGNRTNSLITVTVSNATSDVTRPVVSISSPTGGNVGGLVSVAVSATDNVGVVKVELYVDGGLVSTATAAPFVNKWNTRKAATGAHTLQCRAYDAAGNVGISSIVIVNK